MHGKLFYPIFRVQNNPAGFPKPYNVDLLKRCNLSLSDYVDNHKWVGTGDENCTNPKSLRIQTTFGIEDLGIDYIDLDTYEQETLYKKPNDTSLKWTKTYINKYRVCNTMMVSDDRLTNSGILRLTFHFGGWLSHDIYVHQQGLLFSDLPDAYSHSNLFMGGGYSIPVRYELEQLLKYDGKPCNNNKEYRLDECQRDYIRKVNAKNYVT